jgi:predicted enzyme related to lactoylglutathione lyase
MIKGISDITLFTENSKKLSDFYSNVVGLKLTGEFKMGEDNESVYIYDMKSGANMGIINHSKVKGKNGNPERIIFNLEVDNIKDEVEKVKKAGAKLVQDTYHVEGYGYIATFEDIDGNYFQLVQVRAEA